MIKLNKTSIASLLAIALAIVLANTAMLDQAKTKEVASSSLKVTKITQSSAIIHQGHGPINFGIFF